MSTTQAHPSDAPTLAAPAPGTRRWLVLLISFIESISTILLERGVYFYSKNILHFSDAGNLGLALGIGALYVVGASNSHRLSVWLGERRLLFVVLIMHAVCNFSMALFTGVIPFLFLNFALAFWTGAKWPILEAYSSAGHGVKETSTAVGLFNISWACAVPFAMVASGALIGSTELGNLVGPGLSLFLAAGLANLISLGLTFGLAQQPLHLAHDDDKRPDEALVAHYARLLRSSRISMICSYALLFLLVPLLPGIFADKLHLPVQRATLLASLVEAVRTSMFVVLFFFTKWHGRRDMLIWAAFGLPVGFFVVLFGGDIATHLAGTGHLLWWTHLCLVLWGLTLFGFAAGMVYYASLYYAMVVGNASVDAGGAHEMLIGLGLGGGPLLGLAGIWLSGPLGGYVPGMIAGVGPLAILALVMGLWPVLKK